MSEEKGLYQKFNVPRTDGSSEAGGKHENCRYFVLDLDHDKHTTRAIKGYIDSLRKAGEYPELREDLQKTHADMVEAFGGWDWLTRSPGPRDRR